jgi:hypothetical protein
MKMIPGVNRYAKRPVYETESDRDEQRAVAKVLRAAWQVDVKLMPKLATADYQITREGRLLAIGEHKRRRVTADTYDTLILSYAKARKLLIMGYERRVNVLIIVHYDDQLMWAHLTNAHLEKSRKAGRTDRGDIHDIERCVEIRQSEMKKIKVPD